MHFYSTIQRSPAEIHQTLEQLQHEFSNEPPDLCAIFTAATDPAHTTKLIQEIRSRWPHCCVFGCTAESLVCNAEEWEEIPSVAVWAARLPGVQAIGFRLEYQRTSEGAAFVGWPDPDQVDWASTRGLIALGDPFSFPMDVFLDRMNEDHPGLPIVGGMSSAGHEPNANHLFLNDEVFEEGSIFIQLSGDVELNTVVSQGCRPIGEPMVVTQAEQNAIVQLGGRPALEVLRELFQSLPTSEQREFQHQLQLGRVISEYGEKKTMGDFLIRSIVGIEPDLQAIVVGDYFRPGQTVQFHLRDEDSASFELTQLLKQSQPQGETRGGLLFTCNGRGTRLFSQPHHDAGAIESRFPDLALAGFFAAGEIGPVGNENYFHGFTASALFFSQPGSASAS